MPTTGNILLRTDSYKFTHWKQYPPGTERVYSYFESRGGKWRDVVFFGLQYYLKKFLQGVVVTRQAIDEAQEMVARHFGDTSFFNRAGWEHILRGPATGADVGVERVTSSSERASVHHQPVCRAELVC